MNFENVQIGQAFTVLDPKYKNMVFLKVFFDYGEYSDGYGFNFHPFQLVKVRK